MFAQVPQFVSQRPRYRDREEAADQLIDALRPHLNGDGLILAIPRGAVPMGARIAQALGATLDIVLVRKLGAPYNPEYGLGAIDEDGLVTLGSEAAHLQGSAWLETEAKRQLDLIRARRTLYGPDRMAPPISGRAVVVVDDGLATGVTMVAALDWVRRRGPGRLIAVAPVGSAEAIEWTRNHADQVICPWRPAAFGGVSAFYCSFPQVEDEQVLALLKRHAT